MSIYNAIANAGSNVGAGLNAFAKGRYMVQQQEQQNALAQGERDYARSRNALADQRQVTQEQMAFGQETLARLNALPEEQRQAAFIARVLEARDTIGLPEGYDPAEAWSRIAPQLKPPPPAAAPKRSTRNLPDGNQVTEEWDGQAGAWRQVGEPAPRATGQTINVNTGDASQDALQRALIEDQASNFTAMQDRGRNAQAILAQLSVARNINVETNPGQGYKLIAKQVGSALGLPVDDLEIANAQSFQAVMGRLVNERVSQEKGPQTDADVQRFARTMASLDNGPAAKDFLLGYAEALAMRDVEQATFFRNGTRQRRDFEEMNDEWNAYLDKTPMIRTDLADPTTNLPVFYYQFARKMKEANPGISDADILKEWRSGSR